MRLTTGAERAVVALLQQRLHALAELSELRMRTFAPEEVAAQLVFELADSSGQRRLCYVALFRGAREIKRPRHPEEITNLVHFHRIASQVLPSAITD